MNRRSACGCRNARAENLPINYGWEIISITQNWTTGFLLMHQESRKVVLKHDTALKNYCKLCLPSYPLPANWRLHQLPYIQARCLSSPAMLAEGGHLRGLALRNVR
jgi:hypothetical protein